MSVRDRIVTGNGSSANGSSKQVSMAPYKNNIKIAFITPSISRLSPVSPFMEYLAEAMLPASYGSMEPVWIVIQPELLRDDSESIHFLIRNNFKSDYMEAADFINGGNGDVVLVYYDLSIFSRENGDSLIGLLKRIDVPVLLVLQTIPESLADNAFHDLVNACDAASNVIVMIKHDYELLSSRYAVAQRKIEYISLNLHDDPLDPQINWFHVGRQCWRLVDRHLSRTAGDLRSYQAAREHSVLYGQ